jgi:hypothetical protein
VTVVAVLLIFLVLSACSHLWSAWRKGNASLRSFTRPATTAALVAATLPIAIPAATTLDGESAGARETHTSAAV